MTHFRAHWPIRDDSATLRDLAALALDEFAEMAHRAHVVIVGDIAWGVTENPDGDLTLTATAPVKPVTFGIYRNKHRKAAAWATKPPSPSSAT